jgi:hypothetical protein
MKEPAARPQWIWPPKRVTEGDWVPSVASVKVTEERPTPAPQHVGEVINGVRILALSEGAGQGPCPGQQKPAADMALPFEAGYLPPNTFEIAEPEVVVCPDGAIVYAGRMFEIGVGVGAAFNIDYVWSGLAAAAGTGEVRPITVNGHPGVAIAPEMYEGAEIGPGAVVLVTEHAAIEVYGSSMPLAELIKIAEGVLGTAEVLVIVPLCGHDHVVGRARGACGRPVALPHAGSSRPVIRVCPLDLRRHQGCDGVLMTPATGLDFV